MLLSEGSFCFRVLVYFLPLPEEATSFAFSPAPPDGAHSYLGTFILYLRRLLLSPFRLCRLMGRIPSFGVFLGVHVPVFYGSSPNEKGVKPPLPFLGFPKLLTMRLCSNWNSIRRLEFAITRRGSHHRALMEGDGSFSGTI